MLAVPCRIDRRRSKSCQESHQLTVKGLFLWVGFMAGYGKLLYGVGINDADYSITKSIRVDGRSKIIWMCPIYRTWSNMLLRCYSEKHRHKSPSYAECYVVQEWHSFSSFRSWAVTQPWAGNELDKDLLIPGNKVYSPETCIYISNAINCFLTDRAAGRGAWPLGVSRYCNKKKFLAFCNNPNTGICEYLGGFETPDEAHQAWRRKKHEHACAHAATQDDPRIAEALRNRYV